MYPVIGSYKPLHSIDTSFVKFSHFCLALEEKKKQWRIMRLAMAQCINLLHNNRSVVYSASIPFIVRKTRHILLAMVGLVAGWLADEIRVHRFQNFYKLNFWELASYV